MFSHLSPHSGENASIGCVMSAVPDVHIEWEWRGRAIRNMSLMTFGRQMYMIRESHSPVDTSNNYNDGPSNLSDTWRDHATMEGVGGHADDTLPLDSMGNSNGIGPAVGNDMPTYARQRRSSVPEDASVYRRTSTLYIMNALEKDSGR